MLLITRGIEARSDVAVFADFSQHFIAAGLVDRKRQSKDMVDETWLLWLRSLNSRESLSPVHSWHNLAPRRPAFMRQLIVDD